MTTVKENDADVMFIHSYDSDGITRLYQFDERSDHDLDHNNQVKEIEGFVETRAYSFKNPFLLKNGEKRMYRLGETERSIKIILFSRPDSSGEWVKFWESDHLICRNKFDDSGSFIPTNSRAQTRSYVIVPTEKFGCCHKHGNKFLSVQYRIEFTGPMNMEHIVSVASQAQYETTITEKEKICKMVTYEDRKDYNYLITT